MIGVPAWIQIYVHALEEVVNPRGRAGRRREDREINIYGAAVQRAVLEAPIHRAGALKRIKVPSAHQDELLVGKVEVAESETQIWGRNRPLVVIAVAAERLSGKRSASSRN